MIAADRVYPGGLLAKSGEAAVKADPYAPIVDSDGQIVLCAEYEEARQRWLEGLHGLKRGTRITMRCLDKKEEMTIASWYDEKSFVDESGYVRQVSSIVEHAPVQPVLF